MFCASCGAECLGESSFCGRCGARLNAVPRDPLPATRDPGQALEQLPQEEEAHVQRARQISAHLPRWAKEAIEGESVRVALIGTQQGIISGRAYLIATESHIVFSGYHLNKIRNLKVPYASLLSVEYTKKKLSIVTPFSVNTTSGLMEVLVANAAYAHHDALGMLKVFQEKVSRMCGIQMINIEHVNHLTTETWGFGAPPKLALLRDQSVSGDGRAVETVTEQIRKLSELKDAGILTNEEFVAKKSELLKRI